MFEAEQEFDQVSTWKFQEPLVSPGPCFRITHLLAPPGM
jgi:hypothetical protein